ncbi:hypothetical protein J2P12_01840 [Candidatus Bathyarchaeota archaeon]|nr:hypothetical protein [Candidatus Bathyarchaeota archaeon]
MNKSLVALVAISLAAVVALAWYQSLPQTTPSPSPYWVVYTLTPSGNHTQIRANYSNGVVTTDQIIWLDFNNKTALYNYFRCTPSMPNCTVDECPFTVLVNTATEYRVRVDCTREP